MQLQFTKKFIHPDRVKIITDKIDKNPWQEVQKCIDIIRNNAKNNAKLNQESKKVLNIIYYAGHGVINQRRETFGVIPYHYKIHKKAGNKDARKGVRYFNFSDLHNEMAKYVNSVTVIILDCCRKQLKELYPKLKIGRSVPNSLPGISYLIQAVYEDQSARAGPKGGIFTQQLLKLIQEKRKQGVYSQKIFNSLDNRVLTTSKISTEKFGYYNIFGPRVKGASIIKQNDDFKSKDSSNTSIKSSDDSITQIDQRSLSWTLSTCLKHFFHNNKSISQMLNLKPNPNIDKLIQIPDCFGSFVTLKQFESNSSEFTLFLFRNEPYFSENQNNKQENQKPKFNQIIIAQIKNPAEELNILLKSNLKFNTDYPAIARIDHQIFIAGGYFKGLWMQSLHSFGLDSTYKKPIFLTQFENSLKTPTMLCNKVQSSEINKGGLQFFYLGQADKFTKMNYYFESYPYSDEISQDNILEQNKYAYLNTDSINRQLEDFNYNYSYPAMFIYNQEYLVLFGGIDVFTRKITNRLLLIDIKDLKNPTVQKISQVYSDGQNHKDYFQSNQVSQFNNTFSMRGEHGIYDAKIKGLSYNTITIKVKKILKF
ncbi:UNKNOWN [Stylonychia lemnae]|uniref:Peptidase C14 caspase domain-containing protein n=1 Tax=Stylonychia lemnae TaxID=5949 RepID=A0A078BBW5_STYLE|nr:UNKNOWN [Stylonychia lemnae]|eukprot:CDW91869.1 UNKNOWN [Stylonychia lemnae]